MSHLLLATKLYRPPPRPQLVERPRPTARLKQGLQNKFILVSAPAGFGKTTLVSACLHGIQAGWVSLDESDNDPQQFFTYLIAAVQRIRDVGQAALTLLQSEGAAALESVLTLLINDLAAMPDDFILVLDDYHLIEQPDIHSAMTFWLDHLPQTVHQVILSRSDPPLSLARYRLRGELTELRAEDLRFTVDEAAVFLNHCMNLDLSLADLTILEARTEGWIAGLQAAALSLQGVADPQRFIQAFSGQHQPILDFLIEEVLARQSPARQAFLLQTAILERLHPALCDVVTGRSDSLEMMLQMRRENLFLVPLDEEGHWFRYHHLFRDALFHLLRRHRLADIPDLRRRAADWFREHLLPDEAIRQAILAQDFVLAGDLIAEFAEATWKQGQATTLLHWLRQLPEAERRSSAYLAWLYAWALQLTGEWDLLPGALAEAQAISLDDQCNTSACQVIAAAIRTHLALLKNEPGQALEQAQESLEALPATDWVWRGIFLHHLADAAWRIGDATKAVQAYELAAANGQRAGNLLMQINARRNLGELYQAQGRLRMAETTYRQAIDLATQASGVGIDGRQLPALGNVYGWLGWALYEKGDFTAAEQALHESIAICRRTHYWLGLTVAQGWLAKLYHLWGRFGEADATLQQAKQSAYAGHITLLAGHAQVQQIAFQVARARDFGDETARHAAASWTQAHPHAPEAAQFLSLHPLLWANWHIAEGLRTGDTNRFTQALAFLTAIEKPLAAGGRQGSLLRVRALQAVAYHGLGQGMRAQELCLQLLHTTYPEWFMAPFLEAGQPMLTLLAELREKLNRPEPAAFAGAVINAFLAYTLGWQASRPSPSPVLSYLGETFTARERDVLHLLVKGKTNRAIAAQLVVAESTVKTHLNTIYQKLAVHSRAEALARLRDLNLLT